MTQFDLIVILVLALSGLVGCLRGAVREVLTVLAFVLGLAIAIFTLRFSGPLVRHWLHPAWLGNCVAALSVFFISYLALRLATARLAHNVRQADGLSLLDRVIGLGFGVLRGLVLLGLFQLVFNAATPPGGGPRWIAQSTLYPLTVDCAGVLRLLAPQGAAVANQLAPTLQRAVTQDDAEQPRSGAADTVEKP